MIQRRLLVFGNSNSIHTQKWIEGLALTREWEIHVISMNPAPPLPAIAALPGVKSVEHIGPSNVAEGGRNFQYFYKLPELRERFREINPEAITALYLSSYGVLAALLKGDAELVQYTMGTDVMVFPDQGRLQKLMARMALARADFVVSASRTMTEKLTGQLRIEPDKILTQQYGVGDWLLEVRPDEKKYDFVSNRAWIANSNIDYFLSILRELPSRSTMLIGKTVAGSESLGAKIESLAGAVKECSVHASLPYEQNVRVVASARFAVSLTNSDGASLSVMEAMAVGAIPILSDIAPNREWVSHGQNGFLVPLGNVGEAVSVFKQALALSKQEQLSMIARNREVIFERGLLSRNMKRVSDKMKLML